MISYSYLKISEFHVTYTFETFLFQKNCDEFNYLIT